MSLKKEEGGRQSSLAFWLSLWCLLRSGVCGITGSYCKHHFMVATVFFFLFNSYDYHTFTNRHSLLLCISSSFSFPPIFFIFWKIPRRFGSWRFTWLKSLITALWRLFPITLRENVLKSYNWALIRTMMGIRGFLIFCFVIGPCFMGRLAQFDHRFRTSPPPTLRRKVKISGDLSMSWEMRISQTQGIWNVLIWNFKFLNLKRKH